MYSHGFSVLLTWIPIPFKKLTLILSHIHLNSVYFLFLQNPIVVITPQDKINATRRTKHEFQAIFPDPEDPLTAINFTLFSTT